MPDDRIADLVVRPIASDEFAAVSRLVVAALRAIDVVGVDEVRKPSFVAEFSPEGIARKAASREMLVAVRDGRIVGTGSLGGARVRTLFVAPDEQRRGIGEALVAAVVARARAAGIARLTVDSSIAAEAFYRRQGFKRIEEIVVDGVRTVTMARTL
jgi:GNAT superfamily N-acetyltransferase